MKILIDINHPADVHQFKHLIRKLGKNGDKVLITARNKDCTQELLRKEKIKFIPRKGYYGVFGKLFGMLLIDFFLLRQARKFKPDLLMGSSGNLYIAQVSKLIGKPSLIFDDTEHSTWQNILTFPFATKIITPESYTLNLGKKQVRYNGLKELAYLSPEYFKPNKSVLKKLGLKKTDKFIIIRFVSWDAFHDIGKKRILDKVDFVEKLAKKYKVFISSESQLPKKLKKYKLNISSLDIHSALYYATLVISEGGTMAAESAILGTPIIYINPLTMGYTIELMKKYNLLIQITDTGKIIARTQELMQDKRIKKLWNRRLQTMLKEKIDPNQFYIDVIRGSIK